MNQSKNELLQKLKRRVEDVREALGLLKKEVTERNLGSGPNACYRTKVGCLRICCHGPTMLVYPEGVWYHGMTADRIPEFVRQHLIEGRPVEEWVFARNPLDDTGNEP